MTDEERNSARIREALEAGLGWADVYEDHMGDGDEGNERAR